jgi:RHS repeat-associated protein
MTEYDYYPFGLTMAGISDKAAKTPYSQNKYKYSGKELQNQEFGDGSGWEEYDFESRTYDAQIGRWNSIDPHADNYNSFSPYIYVGNNPFLLIDPNGKDWFYYDDNSNSETGATWHWHNGGPYLPM